MTAAISRVLLTGAGGFAGSHCLEHVLATTPWHIVCTDSFRHEGKTDRISELLDAGPDSWRARVEVITHDLTAPFSVQAIHRVGPADAILAYASESSVDRSITDPVTFTRNNVLVALSTLELARAIKPRHVIMVSTDEVYGPQVGGTPHREWAPICPSNPYAASKASQEAIAISYWRAYSVPVTLVNCMNLFGERQSTEKFVPMVTRRCLRGETVTIHGTPGDIGSRHYLHARNLADGLVFLLGRDPVLFAGHDNSGPQRPARWNIASPDRIDNLTMARMIADETGRELKWQLEDFHRARPGHDPHYGLDPGAITALGWKAPVPFAESLGRTVRWSLAHPRWLDG